jgi:hypothetical protein
LVNRPSAGVKYIGRRSSYGSTRILLVGSRSHAGVRSSKKASHSANRALATAALITAGFNTGFDRLGGGALNEGVSSGAEALFGRDSPKLMTALTDLSGLTPPSNILYSQTVIKFRNINMRDGQHRLREFFIALLAIVALGTFAVVFLSTVWLSQPPCKKFITIAGTEYPWCPEMH